MLHLAYGEMKSGESMSTILKTTREKCFTLFLLWLSLSPLSATEKLQVTPETISTEKTQIISLYCPKCADFETEDVEIQFIDPENIFQEGVFPAATSEGFEVLVLLTVDTNASLGERTVRLLIDGLVVAEGTIIIEPTPPYSLAQGPYKIREYADKNEDIILSYYKHVYIKVNTSKQNPDEIAREFILSTPIKEADGLQYYDLGSFQAGDQVHISLYPDSTFRDIDVILPNRTILIRPGPISIRSGFLFVLGDAPDYPEKIIPTIGFKTRFFQSDAHESWALSLGFSMGVQSGQQVYNLGLGADYANLVGLSFGISGKDDGKAALTSAPTLEIALDLRLLKMMVNKVF